MDVPIGAGSGPGAAQERPKGPGGAQKGSPDAKTFGYLSLTDVFEGVDAPKTHHLQGFSHRASIIVEPSRRPCRGSRAARYTDENTVRNHWSKGLSRQLRDRCALASVH